MDVYLLRHGATDYTKDGRYQGSHDVPLSPEGAAALHKADFCPDTVYCSPLRRAMQSAALYFPQARLVPVQDLREMNFGVFEGRSPDQMEDDPVYRAWVDSGCTGPIPHGDTKDAFQARACAAFASLLDTAFAEGRDRLVIVAHGGVQMAILERFALPRKPFWKWCGPLGGGYRLDPRRWPEERLMELVDTVRYTAP